MASLSTEICCAAHHAQAIYLASPAVPNIPGMNYGAPPPTNTAFAPTAAPPEGWLTRLFSHHHRSKARLTAYWCSEDRWTRRHQSSTGIRLRMGMGYCAVDPQKIPYGSVITIPGLGKFLAVDTGSAVVSRKAARNSGHTSSERNAIVIDIFVGTKKEGRYFEAYGPKFADVSWSPPDSNDTDAVQDRQYFADIDWSRLQSLHPF